MSQQITKIEGFLGGLFWSIGVVILAMILAGAGHGWLAALGASLCSLVLAPIAGYNYANPRGSRLTAEIVLIVAICVDLYLVIGTWAYGINLFLAAYEHLSPLVFAFIGMWIAWQVLPVLSILRPRAA